jgi:hypothetical protein
LADDGQTQVRALWLLADELRTSARGPLELIQAAVDRGLVHSWRNLASFAYLDAAEVVDPRYVADFAATYLGGDGPKRVLDPWAGLGVTMAAHDAAGLLDVGACRRSGYQQRPAVADRCG